MRLLLALIIITAAAPGFAQDRPPQGIGFVQAEEGTWLCRHEDPLEALKCATEQCSEQSPGQTCFPTAWCLPANWSGVMVIWLGEFHASHALCGAPDEVAMQDALRAICAGSEGATHCDLVQIIDPDGNERDIVGISFPGPLAPVSPEAAGEPEPEPGASGG